MTIFVVFRMLLCLCCCEKDDPVETSHERYWRGRAKALMVPHSDFTTARLKLVVSAATVA